MTDAILNRALIYRQALITDGSRTSGIGFGDARISPGAPGPGRHIHTHEDEAIYVISGILTVEV